MALLKRLETLAKSLGALVLAVFLWRPWRHRRFLAPPRRLLLVRTDNRVGEALLTTPLLEALAALPSPPEVDVLIHRRVARVLEGHPHVRRILVLGQDCSLLSLRREGYDAVVDCGNWTAPSVHNAIFARLAAARAPLLGPDAFPVRFLHTHPVPARRDTRSEVLQRLHLLSPLAPGSRARPPAGEAAAPASSAGAAPSILIGAPLSFRAPRVSDALRELVAEVEAGRFAVVNPGGRLGWRRIDPGTFAAAARALIERGRTPLVTWGPGEEPLAREVVAAAPGARLAPPTDLDGLAALMRAAGLTVCNNTGPMHLSVAVGAPTLAFFLHMDVERWGHAHPPHAMVDFTAAARAGLDLAPVAREAVARFLAALGR